MKDNKGYKYDEMVKNPSNDQLGLFTDYEEILENLRRLILESSPMRILDIGCGTGNLTGPLSNEINVIGIDKNSEMISRGKEKFDQMEFVCSDLSEGILNYKIFDSIVSSFVLHGIDDTLKEEIISQATNLVDKSGKIFICDYMFENNESKEKYLKSLEGRKELIDFVSSKKYIIISDFEVLLEKYGLILEKKEHIVNLTWMVIFRKIS